MLRATLRATVQRLLGTKGIAPPPLDVTMFGEQEWKMLLAALGDDPDARARAPADDDAADDDSDDDADAAATPSADALAVLLQRPEYAAVPVPQRAAAAAALAVLLQTSPAVADDDGATTRGGERDTGGVRVRTRAAKAVRWQMTSDRFDLLQARRAEVKIKKHVITLSTAGEINSLTGFLGCVRVYIASVCARVCNLIRCVCARSFAWNMTLGLEKLRAASGEGASRVKPSSMAAVAAVLPVEQPPPPQGGGKRKRRKRADLPPAVRLEWNGSSQLRVSITKMIYTEPKNLKEDLERTGVLYK